jgi:hypothetical protein
MKIPKKLKFHLSNFKAQQTKMTNKIRVFFLIFKVLLLKLFGRIQLNILPVHYTTIKNQINPVFKKKKRSAVSGT